MRILLTNDDGIEAVGLSVLLSCCEGDDVFIVAPDRQQSAQAASITLRRPISYREAHIPGTEGAFSCNGTPADCAKLALGKLAPWPPSLLISGCNEGLNIGFDVFYSGTIASAMEGIFVNVPSMAVSLQKPIQKSLKNAIKYLKQLIDIAVSWKGAGKLLLNVNIPCSPNPPILITHHGKAAYRYWYENAVGGDHGFCWLRGESTATGFQPGSDAAAVVSGAISISPLRPSFSAYPFDSRPYIADLAERINRIEGSFEK